MSEVGPAAFNNRDATYASLRFVSTTVGESMFNQDPEGKTMGRLVRDWTLEDAPGGVVYTFNLQPGVKWHDNLGDWGEFNAADLTFNIDLVTADRSVHAVRSGMTRAYKCDQCDLVKVDDLTVQLFRPAPTFEIFWYSKQPAGSLLSFQNKRHIETRGEDAATLEPVYRGSWEIIDFKTGESYKMRAVQDHWRHTPEWEFLNWIGIAEESTRIANFLTDNIDSGKFGLEAIQEIKDYGNPDHKFMTFPNALVNRIQLFGMYYTADDPAHVPGPDGVVPVELAEGFFHCELAWVPCDGDESSEGWATALKVRLALNLAGDRQKLVNNLTFGLGTPASISHWGGHGVRSRQQGLDELQYAYDPVEAKRLMTEAGWGDGFEIDMVHPDLFPQGRVGGTAVCVMWLEALNVRCNEKPLPYSSFRPTLVVRNYQGAYTHGLGQQIEPLWIMQLFYDIMGGFNYGFEHPTLQKMIDKGASLNDDDARWSNSADMSRWMFENAMLVNMYSEPQIFPVGPRIDTRDVMPGPVVDMNNWEFVPHR